MTQQDALERATEALANNDREAADFYLMYAQLDPNILRLQEGAERMKGIALIVGTVVLLCVVAGLVKWLGL